jgi:hypothetical protein
MKTLSILALVALLAGCSTVDRRIEEKSGVFNALDADTQDQLRQGMVEVGYTPDMVYIALGRPDEKRAIVTTTAREEVWVYSTYFSEYVGSTVRYRRYIAMHPRTGQRVVYFEPVRDHLYVDRAEDRIRITFRDGKVSMIEEVQR